jgi:hypothetical protein
MHPGPHPGGHPRGHPGGHPHGWPHAHWGHAHRRHHHRRAGHHHARRHAHHAHRHAHGGLRAEAWREHGRRWSRTHRRRRCWARRRGTRARRRARRQRRLIARPVLDIVHDVFAACVVLLSPRNRGVRQANVAVLAVICANHAKFSGGRHGEVRRWGAHIVAWLLPRFSGTFSATAGIAATDRPATPARCRVSSTRVAVYTPPRIS